MPRSTNATLDALLPACETQSTVDIKLLSEATPYYFSTNVDFSASGNNYVKGLLRVGELKETQNTATNRVQVKLSNVDLVWGLKLASDLRKLELADVVIRRLFRSLSNPATTEHRHFFTGKLVNAEANLREINFDVIPDTTAAGFCIATENLTPANGWRFPESPSSSTPGTGTNPGGGIGGGRCFALETLIWTAGGSIPIGDFPLGIQEKKIPVISFDFQTGRVETDEIEEVFEHTQRGYFTLYFEAGSLRVTPMHRFLTGLGQWTRAEDFCLKSTTKIFPNKWADSRLIGFSWHSGEITVRNFRVKRNKTYFAGEGRFAVSNLKLPSEIP